jgi:hypothetical protein
MLRGEANPGVAPRTRRKYQTRLRHAQGEIISNARNRTGVAPVKRPLTPDCL